MIFITGFPGFLATELMHRIVKQKPNARFMCLVQNKFLAIAEIEKMKFPEHSIELIDGDITVTGLGLPASVLANPIEEIYHFAAVYDLNVPEAVAYKINVLGTENVLKIAQELASLKRFHYVSTCYVSGKYVGRFSENDLEKGQQFNNFYESTKYEAEKRVRAAMASGMPATIYRPAVVVGNSHTGATQKFDGPYFIMQWLLRQPTTAILPRLIYPEKFFINVVPSNYVLDSLAYLSQQAFSLGKTYQLADPNPLTVEQMIATLGSACGRKVISIPLPKAFAKFAVGNIPGLENWLGIPQSALDYFAHPTHYSTELTKKDLEGSGIDCPPFPTYASTLADFMKKHPELRSKAMI